MAEQKTLCPCCKQPLTDTADLTFYDPANVVLRGTVLLTLTDREYWVLKTLHSEYPGIATKEKLFQSLYWLHETDEPDPKIVDVFVCKIRKKLPSKMAIEICTSWGRGYHLVIHPLEKVGLAS
ncbi:winged helix-turn-helix domain-containing protein [uncultured Cohaesibacter sp.]|uniref:helix-turn-helix domain-containing protein n=1 Tax=uncultured Cohaesibacter sp. TaxID=1002546 RepID=UPI0029C73FA8|nr:winged helix-turn-helix domain-containing protein [uncultured Cohaesibacter sp.]